MKVSAKTEYACLALIELAAHHESANPIRVRDIAERHKIPQRFLVQILLQLKAVGLVTSTRGSAGGYRLAREPATLSVLEILTAIDGSARVGYDLGSEVSATQRTVRSLWREVDEMAEQLLDRTSLAELVGRASQEATKPVVGDWI